MVIILSGNKEVVDEIFYKVEPFIEKYWKKKYPYKKGKWQQIIPMDKENPMFNYVVETARNHKIGIRFFQHIYYSKMEIENIQFFQMNVPLITEFEGTEAKDYGTKFSGGCNVCGIDAKLNSDLIINKTLLKKFDIGNANPCIFVSERLKNLILNNKFTGVSFNRIVKDYKERKINNYYVMDIDNILPRMNLSTWLLEGPTESCGHKTVYLQSDIKYDKEALDNAYDFNLTYEYINNFKLRQIIVSANVRNIFKNNKIYSGFTPIYLGNDNDFMPQEPQR